MAIEVMSAKLITPFFGMSLYVWASVLSITLLSLTIGYYLGGIKSKNTNFNKYMNFLFITVSVYTILLPYISNFLLSFFIYLPLEVGIIISAISILTLPLILLGSSTPMIINHLTTDEDSAGLNTGNVFSISTFGGIVFVFLFGHFLIPFLGVKMSSIIAGLFLLLAFLLLKTNQLLEKK